MLVEKWDADHNTFQQVNPVKLIRSLMNDHKMKARDLVKLLGISKGYVSDILNYKKGLSKDTIRKLSEHFKVSQEAFNRPYKLAVSENSRIPNARVIKRKKKLTGANQKANAI